MTPIAQRAEAAADWPRWRPSRASLAAKLSVAFLGLVAFVLIVNGALDTYLTYGQAKRAALEVESEKARAAAERVGVFLDEIQTELGWTAGVEWGYAKPEQQRYDFIRLLRQAPAITALSFLDAKGREQLAVSRLEPDAVASGKDFSADPRFLRAVADKIWFGPVEFRRGSEPYMTVALAHVGKTPGVTVADVNLKLVWDVVSAIHVGDKGFAYVVDDRGRLIAHPDLSLVLRDTDFSHLPQVAAALAGRGSEAEEARSLDGASVLTAHAVAPKTRWTVFVEQPLAEALGTAYGSLMRSLALLGLGLALAAVSGVALARRMAAPIRLLQSGADKLGSGDLAQRLDIRTGDEIEALAGGFNRMAQRLQESYENLEGKVEARTRDLNEALERQTATSEILRAIAGSPSDAQPVFESIVISAVKRLRCDLSLIFLADDTIYRPVAGAGSEGLLPDLGPSQVPIDWDGNFPSRALLSKETYYLPDWNLVELPPHERAIHELMGLSSSLYIPLIRDGEARGALGLGRTRPSSFSVSDIAQAEAFRDQAIIALENARLFAELQAKTHDLEESLAQQTATAEVLKVISRSAFGLKAVLQTLVDSAVRLCAQDGVIYLRDGDVFRAEAAFGAEVAGRDPRGRSPRRPGRDSITGRVALSARVEQIPDNEADPEFQVAPAQRMNMRALLGVPLMLDGEVEGVFVLAKPDPGLFSDRAVELVRSFADQAVIAIQNVRLFDAVQAKTHDLEELLTQQTATADVLKVISRSAFDLDAVFQTLVACAVDLCKASSGTLCVRDGDVFRYRGMAGPEASADLQRYLGQHPLSPPTRQTAAGRAILSRQTEQIEDVLREPDYAVPFDANGSGARALLAIPMLGKADVQGAIVVARSEPGPFPARHVEILRTFADQAVIAIENSRLFEEVQARTRDLSEALRMQTATSDALKVISRSAFDLQKVLDTLVASAATLCEAEKACIFLRRGEDYHWVSNFGFSQALVDYAAAHPFQVGGGAATSRVVRDRTTVHIPDVLADADYRASEYQRLGDYRTMLGVPLLRNGDPLGVFIMTRREVRPFNSRQIELLQSFADQAVIAIENSRLFEEVQARTRELEQSLSDLRKAQDRLVQSEKLASLGQLTAGIAHEIKNPLNFVNNFASLSRELLEELRELLLALPEKARADADELIGMIDSNLEKVASHGKRADSIVKNMLLHSREGSGERARVNVNAMVEEALNLGYHGARAEKPGFNVTLERDFDPAAGEANVYLQEVTRVLLNLISNGFYASAKRALREGPDYAPALKAATRDLGHSVEIRIRDNGTGIPDEVRAKMFNPFFTTKPAGEGTGLGLSLSHDIVVKQHGGSLDVETAPGAFTEFVITLPREGAGA